MKLGDVVEYEGKKYEVVECGKDPDGFLIECTGCAFSTAHYCPHVLGELACPKTNLILKEIPDEPKN